MRQSAQTEHVCMLNVHQEDCPPLEQTVAPWGYGANALSVQCGKLDTGTSSADAPKHTRHSRQQPTHLHAGIGWGLHHHQLRLARDDGSLHSTAAASNTPHSNCQGQ
jgi:hypothetical protein